VIATSFQQANRGAYEIVIREFTLGAAVDEMGQQ
jgi:hypothetical protein